MFGAYPKILQLGDKAIADLFNGDVEITEKVDGSQFGFGRTKDGELFCRSKGKLQDLEDPDKIFAPAVEYVKSIADKIPTGHIFYGETLHKPRHSTLAYNNVPKNHIALFGVMTDSNKMHDYKGIEQWAKDFDVDVVPLIHTGKSDAEHTISLLERESYLGGQKIEGVVVKRYEDWMFLGQILTPVKAGKYVSEAFKEVHQRDWSKLNTGKGQLDVLKEKHRTEARSHKALMHLPERGAFEGTVRDIGNLIKEVQNDLVTEEKENIKDDLYRVLGSDVVKNSTKGFVDWYKEELAKGSFQDDQRTNVASAN